MNLKRALYLRLSLRLSLSGSMAGFKRHHHRSPSKSSVTMTVHPQACDARPACQYKPYLLVLRMPTPKHTPTTNLSLSPPQFPRSAQRAAAAVTEPLFLSGGQRHKKINPTTVAQCGVCALATHPEQYAIVYNAETCVEEGPQDATGELLGVGATPGAAGGVEFSVPRTVVPSLMSRRLHRRRMGRRPTPRSGSPRPRRWVTTQTGMLTPGTYIAFSKP